MTINRKYRPDVSPVVIALLCFVFITGIANLNGVDPYKSFWSNFERMEGYITIIHLMFFFFMVKSAFMSRKVWNVYFAFIVAVALMECFYAVFLQKTGMEARVFRQEFGDRIYGDLGNPSFFASYLLMAVIICIILWSHLRNAALKYLVGAGLASMIIVIYMTGNRAAIIGIAAGFCFLGLLSLPKVLEHIGSRLRNYAAIFLVVVIAAGLLFSVSDMAEDVLEHETVQRFSRMLNNPSEDTAIAGRLSGWKLSWDAVKVRPLLGWGQDNFVAVHSVAYLPAESDPQWRMDRAHNIMLEWALSAGVFGVLGYFAVLFTAIAAAYRAFRDGKIRKLEYHLILSGLIAYIIHNMFSFDTINTYLPLIALLAYTDTVGNFAEISDSEGRESGEKGLNSAGTKSVLAVMVMLISVLSLYYFNYKPIVAARMLNKLNASNLDDPSFPTLQEYFREMLSYNTFANSAIRRNMGDVSNSVISNKAFELEGAVKFVEFSAKELQVEVGQSSYDLERLQFAINFYINIARFEPSVIPLLETLIQRGLQINPRFEKLYLMQADVHILKKEYDKAYDIVTRLVSPDDSNDAMQFKKALASIFTGRNAEVVATLEKVVEIRSNTDPEIASGKKPSITIDELILLAHSYMQVNSYLEAVNYYEKALVVMLSEDTHKGKIRDRAWLHFQIAKSYAGAGLISRARDEAATAAKLNPDEYEDEYEELLKLAK
ncbi:MAG: O-antigen ligase family protein [Nitrospira sp.]|nr:O-antigen ligase family protein [Nitrospira sp.]